MNECFDILWKKTQIKFHLVFDLFPSYSHFLNEISISIDLRAILYCFTIKYAWNLPILIYLFTDYPYSIGFCYANISVVLQASLLWQIQAFLSIVTSSPGTYGRLIKLRQVKTSNWVKSVHQNLVKSRHQIEASQYIKVNN